jgi:hypothetical protein
MKIEYYHASKFGNGAKIAEEFKAQMAVKGVVVNTHHVRDIKPKEIPPADLYLFSSPGRFGKPIGDMQNFLKKINLPSGTKYALVVTELCPNPENVKRMPSEDEVGKCQRVISIMNKELQKKGLVKVGEDKIFVTGIKGPLEQGWQKIVGTFISRIPTQSYVPEDKSLTGPQVVSMA